MKRNDFLKKAFAGAVAVFALGRQAFSRLTDPAGQRKPPLTPGNLNRFFAKYEQGNADRSLNLAITDAKAFVEKHFSYISPQQKERIGKIKKEDWEGIQSVINDLKLKKGRIEFTFINKPGIGDWVAECDIEARLLQIGPEKVEIRKYLVQ